MFKKILLVASSVISLSIIAGITNPFAHPASAFNTLKISEVTAVKTSSTTVKVSWKYCETIITEMDAQSICVTPSVDFTGGIKNPITGAPSHFDITQYNAQYSARIPDSSTACGANQTVTFYVRSAGHNGDLFSTTCDDINGNVDVQDSTTFNGKNCETDYEGALLGDCKAIQSCMASGTGNTESTCRSALTACTDAGGQISVCQNEISKGNITFDPTQNPDGEAEPVCGGGLALAWILCPLTSVVQSSIDSLAKFIQNFMHFEPLIGSDQGNAILSVWRMVVGVANLLLVLAFLVVIFSQATSVGLSAYGIKKMLPRIILAAILLNISFYICAAAVDVTNVIGGSLQGILNTATNAIPAPDNTVARTAFSNVASNYGEIILAIMAGLVTTTILAVTGHIAFIVPILLTAVVSLFFLLLVLSIRHILTVMLIIISPLAFAAMILPNTDGFFKKWWKAFYISLAIYPVIMGLAYGSMLVSKIILISTPKQDGLEATIWQGVAFVTLFAWIWALKFIVTWGGGVAGRLAGMVNDKNKGLIDGSRNWARGYRKMRKEENQTSALRYDGGGNRFLKPIRSVRQGAARISTNYQARQSAASENLKDQQRKHIISKVTENDGHNAFADRLAGPNASEQQRMVMVSRYENEEERVKAEATRYASKKLPYLNAMDKDSPFQGYDASGNLITTGADTMAELTYQAIKSGDLTKARAIAIQAGKTGADEYRAFYSKLQDRIDIESGKQEGEEWGSERRDSAGGWSAERKSQLNELNSQVLESSGGDLGSKNRALVDALNQGSTISIDAVMKSNDMISYAGAMGGAQISQWSTGTAREWAEHTNDAALKMAIENSDIRGSTKKGTYQALYYEYVNRFGIPQDSSIPLPALSDSEPQIITQQRSGASGLYVPTPSKTPTSSSASTLASASTSTTATQPVSFTYQQSSPTPPARLNIDVTASGFPNIASIGQQINSAGGYSNIDTGDLARLHSSISSSLEGTSNINPRAIEVQQQVSRELYNRGLTQVNDTWTQPKARVDISYGSGNFVDMPNIQQQIDQGGGFAGFDPGSLVEVHREVSRSVQGAESINPRAVQMQQEVATELRNRGFTQSGETWEHPRLTQTTPPQSAASTPTPSASPPTRESMTYFTASEIRSMGDDDLMQAHSSGAGAAADELISRGYRQENGDWRK